MNKAWFTLLLLSLFNAHVIAADGGATKADAEAMVKKGVAAIKSEGKEKAYEEISTKGGKFSFQDLYLVVYGLDGMVYARGAN